MNNALVQPDPGLYVWTILTFLVLLALLAKFAWRPLLEALERRQESIRKSLDDARQARQEVEQLRAESAGIVKNAERQIELETARALQQIRHEAVDLSLAIASKLLQRNLSKDDNARLIEDTFKRIEASERPS